MGLTDVVDDYDDFKSIFDPVAQLVEVGSDGRVVRRFCTGFNFRLNQSYRSGAFFLTAGHCLRDVSCELYPGDDLSKLRVSYQYQTEKDEKLYPIVQVMEHGRCSYGQTDYVILSIDEDAYKRFGSFPLSTALFLKGETITVVQHPRGEKKQYGMGQIQKGDTRDPFFDHTVTTFERSSGSPVIVNVYSDSPSVVAVHVSGSIDGRERPAQEHHYAVTVSDIASQSIFLQASGFFHRQSGQGIRLGDAGASQDSKQRKGCCT